MADFTHSPVDWAVETTRQLRKSVDAARLQPLWDEVRALSLAAGRTFAAEDWSATEAVTAPPSLNPAALNRIEDLFSTVGATMATKLDRSMAASTYQPIGDYATNTALTTGLDRKQDTGDYATRSELRTEQEVIDLITANAPRQDVSAFQTAPQVRTIIEGYGYRTNAQVRTTVESYGYQTEGQVRSIVEGIGLEDDMGNPVDLSAFLRRDDAANTYLSITNAQSTYLPIASAFTQAAADQLYVSLTNFPTTLGDGSENITLWGLNAINVRLGSGSSTNLISYIQNNALGSYYTRTETDTAISDAVAAIVLPDSGLTRSVADTIYLQQDLTDFPTALPDVVTIGSKNVADLLTAIPPALPTVRNIGPQNLQVSTIVSTATPSLPALATLAGLTTVGASGVTTTFRGPVVFEEGVTGDNVGGGGGGISAWTELPAAINRHLIPDASTRHLGSDSTGWGTGYIGTVLQDDASNSELVLGRTGSHDVIIRGRDLNFSDITNTIGDLIPKVGGANNLGTALLSWNNIYGHRVYGGELHVEDDTSGTHWGVHTNLLPNPNNSLDLGSSGRRWAEGYINTVHAGTGVRTPSIYAASGGITIGVAGQDTTLAGNIRGINYSDIEGNPPGGGDSGGNAWSDNVDSTIQPAAAADGDYDIGASGRRFRDGVFSRNVFAGIFQSQQFRPTLTVGSSVGANSTNNIFETSWVQTSRTNTVSAITGTLTVNSPHIAGSPQLNADLAFSGQHDIATASQPAGTIYARDKFVLTGTTANSNQIEANFIVPHTENDEATGSLGRVGRRWNEAHIKTAEITQLKPLTTTGGTPQTTIGVNDVSSQILSANASDATARTHWHEGGFQRHGDMDFDQSNNTRIGVGSPTTGNARPFTSAVGKKLVAIGALTAIRQSDIDGAFDDGTIAATHIRSSQVRGGTTQQLTLGTDNADTQREGRQRLLGAWQLTQNNLYVGTGSTDATLHFNSGGEIGGAVTFADSTTFDWANTSHSNVPSEFTSGSATVDWDDLTSSLVPRSSAAINIGSSTIPFTAVYTPAIRGGGTTNALTIGGSDTGTVTLGRSGQRVEIASGATVDFNDVQLEGTANFPTGTGTGGDSWDTPVDANITFDTDNTYSIGTSAAAAQKIHVRELVRNENNRGQPISFSSNVRPGADSDDNLYTINFGTAGRRFANFFTVNLSVDGALSFTSDGNVGGIDWTNYTNKGGTEPWSGSTGTSVDWTAVANNILSGTGGSYNLGASGDYWANAYITNTFTRSIQSGGTNVDLDIGETTQNVLISAPLRVKTRIEGESSSHDLTIGGSNTQNVVFADDIHIGSQTIRSGSSSVEMKLGHSSDTSISLGNNLIPLANNTINLGSSAEGFENLYVDSILADTDTGTITIGSANQTVNFPGTVTGISGGSSFDIGAIGSTAIQSGDSGTDLTIGGADNGAIIAADNIFPGTGVTTFGSSASVWFFAYFGTVFASSLRGRGVSSALTIGTSGTGPITLGRTGQTLTINSDTVDLADNALTNVATINGTAVDDLGGSFDPAAITADLIPSGDRELGSSTAAWRRAYINELQITGGIRSDVIQGRVPADNFRIIGISNNQLMQIGTSATGHMTFGRTGRNMTVQSDKLIVNTALDVNTISSHGTDENLTIETTGTGKLRIEADVAGPENGTVEIDHANIRETNRMIKIWEHIGAHPVGELSTTYTVDGETKTVAEMQTLFGDAQACTIKIGALQAGSTNKYFWSSETYFFDNDGLGGHFAGIADREVPFRSVGTDGVSATPVTIGNLNYVWDFINQTFTTQGGGAALGAGNRLEIWIRI